MYEYFQLMRLDAAKKMLLDRDKTLDIVTLKLGYTDSRSFTDLFKKITGMTPVEYKHTQN